MEYNDIIIIEFNNYVKVSHRFENSIFLVLFTLLDMLFSIVILIFLQTSWF